MALIILFFRVDGGKNCLHPDVVSGISTFLAFSEFRSNFVLVMFRTRGIAPPVREHGGSIHHPQSDCNAGRIRESCRGASANRASWQIGRARSPSGPRPPGPPRPPGCGRGALARHAIGLCKANATAPCHWPVRSPQGGLPLGVDGPPARDSIGRRAGRDLRDLRDLRDVAGGRLRTMPFASAKQNATAPCHWPVRSPQAYSLCKAPTQAHPGGLGGPGGPGQGTFQRQRASRLPSHRSCAFPATGSRLSSHRPAPFQPPALRLSSHRLAPSGGSL